MSSDKPRPIPNWDHYKTNWDRIFEHAKDNNNDKEETDEEVLAKIPFGRG